jgi:hypothetical protein
MMKKRYACIKIDAKTKKPIMNKKKIYSKGIMLARRDQCSWAKETFENTLWDDLLRKDLQVLAVEMAEKMLAPLRWQYPLQSFAVTQKLGYDYANDSYPLKLFAEHLEDIGKPARANDRVQYVVTKCPHLSADAKLGYKYRLIETLRDEMANNTNSIDHMYYIERLKNDMDQILSIGYMDQIAKFNSERTNKTMAGKVLLRGEIQKRIHQMDLEIATMQEQLQNSSLTKEEQKIMKRNMLKKETEKKNAVKDELGPVEKAILDFENGKSVSEVPKKHKGFYKGIIKLHLDQDIFKHQLRLIRHYSDAVVSELKSLIQPLESRNSSFSKTWLFGDDGLVCFAPKRDQRPTSVPHALTDLCSIACSEPMVVETPIVAETPTVVEKRKSNQKKLTEFNWKK